MSILKNEAQDLINASKDKGGAIENMIIAGAGVKEEVAYWKELGANTDARGFKPQFYAYLREGIKTMDEVSAFVKENGSVNDFRYLKLFEGIADLANSIHNDLA